ncbi:MAG: inositol monophosphatase [Anaerolineae bacterium]|nr:inositol monophosphatase [Anaerolineae bacterium]
MSFLQTAVAAAEAAAEAIRRARVQPLEVKSKGYRDIVTAADFAAERAIVEVIHRTYPDHAILSEEDAALDLAAWTPPGGVIWIIDPLDGTTNFSRGIPSYSTSVGVMVDGVLEAGVIIDPVRNFTFAGARGQGATLNGAPMQVNTHTGFSEAVVGCDWARDPGARATLLAIVGQMAIHCRTIRTEGSAALHMAYVAAGWYDLYFHTSLSPWDMAAGVLLIEEAGGQVTSLYGAPFDITEESLLVSNGLLHAEAVVRVQRALSFIAP